MICKLSDKSYLILPEIFLTAWQFQIPGSVIQMCKLFIFCKNSCTGQSV